MQLSELAECISLFGEVVQQLLTLVWVSKGLAPSHTAARDPTLTCPYSRRARRRGKQTPVCTSSDPPNNFVKQVIITDPQVTKLVKCPRWLILCVRLARHPVTWSNNSLDIVRKVFFRYLSLYRLL